MVNIWAVLNTTNMIWIPCGQYWENWAIFYSIIWSHWLLSLHKLGGVTRLGDFTATNFLLKVAQIFGDTCFAIISKTPLSN